MGEYGTKPKAAKVKTKAKAGRWKASNFLIWDKTDNQFKNEELINVNKLNEYFISRFKSSIDNDANFETLKNNFNELKEASNYNKLMDQKLKELPNRQGDPAQKCVTMELVAIYTGSPNGKGKMDFQIDNEKDSDCSAMSMAKNLTTHKYYQLKFGDDYENFEEGQVKEKIKDLIPVFEASLKKLRGLINELVTTIQYYKDNTYGWVGEISDFYVSQDMPDPQGFCKDANEALDKADRALNDLKGANDVESMITNFSSARDALGSAVTACNSTWSQWDKYRVTSQEGAQQAIEDLERVKWASVIIIGIASGGLVEGAGFATEAVATAAIKTAAGAAENGAQQLTEYLNGCRNDLGVKEHYKKVFKDFADNLLGNIIGGKVGSAFKESFIGKLLETGPAKSYAGQIANKGLEIVKLLPEMFTKAVISAAIDKIFGLINDGKSYTAEEFVKKLGEELLNNLKEDGIQRLLKKAMEKGIITK